MSGHKTFDIKVIDRRKDGGRIVISTGAVDRDKDRVFPTGAKIENYLKNPVVLWGHDYYSAASLIGRAKSIEVNEDGIVADFELRPAATEHDPQHIVLLLWEQDFVRASSIGFRPETMVSNEFGGVDFVSWELLEFSLVPVPANQEALRLAAKAYPRAFEEYQKRGRTLSSSNERKLVAARDALNEVLSSVASDDDNDDKTVLDVRLRRLEQKIDTLLRPRPQDPPSPEDDAAQILARLDRIKSALSSA